MKRTLALAALCLSLGSVALAQTVTPAPPLMNFQGRLATPSGNPVPDGLYTVVFSLYDALTGGNLKWTQTFTGVGVKNGVFAVPLGTTGTQGAIAPSSPLNESLFTGNRWLQIQLGSNTVPLLPRTPLVTVPYAFKANTVADGAIRGASIANGVITADKFAANVFNPLAWLLNGNSGVTSGFLGTTDNKPLEFRVNNHRGMRYSYAENTLSTGNEYRSINTLGGSEINSISTGVVGATISGGGRDLFTGTDSPNRVSVDFGTISGGTGNTASGYAATVAGGDSNTASGYQSAVGGGTFNSAGRDWAFIGGGLNNFISAEESFIGGGDTNSITNECAAIVGGDGNLISAMFGFIGGGQSNQVGGMYGTILGGLRNVANGSYGFAAGQQAQANHTGSFVWNDAHDTTSGHSFASTAPNQFLVQASGGVGINTNDPAGFALNVNGTGKFSGSSNGYGIIGINASTGNYARLGTAGYAVDGAHFSTGNNGTLGGADFGASGEYKENGNIGFLGIVDAGVVGLSTHGRGVYGKSTDGVGVYGSSGIYGVFGHSDTIEGVRGDTDTGKGVHGSSVSGEGIYGTSGSGSATVGESTNGIGIVGTSVNSFGVYGRSNNNYAGYFNGRVFATSYTDASDVRYKTNINPLENPLNTILNMRGVSYDWKRDEFKDMNFDAGRQIGFIAQELEKVLPELVHTDSKGYKSVNYGHVVPVLVEGIKAQQKEITTLKETLAGVMKRLEALENSKK